jgi:hypothetical protein
MAIGAIGGVGGQPVCAPCKGIGLQSVRFGPGKGVAPAGSHRSGAGPPVIGNDQWLGSDSKKKSSASGSVAAASRSWVATPFDYSHPWEDGSLSQRRTDQKPLVGTTPSVPPKVPQEGRGSLFDRQIAFHEAHKGPAIRPRLVGKWPAIGECDVSQGDNPCAAGRANQSFVRVRY